MPAGDDAMLIEQFAGGVTERRKVCEKGRGSKNPGEASAYLNKLCDCLVQTRDGIPLWAEPQRPNPYGSMMPKRFWRLTFSRVTERVEMFGAKEELQF